VTALAVSVCRLFWFTFSYFITDHSWSVRRSWKLPKSHQNPNFRIQGHRCRHY